MSNGATALVKTLVNAGITTCFTNPGTSEMHFVAALDSAPEMRAVLTLFEGVATCPGGPMQAAMASAASWQSACVVLEVRTKPGDTLRATVSMSDCNCESYCVW